MTDTFTPTPAQLETLRRFCRLSGFYAECHHWGVSADCICQVPTMQHSHQVVGIIEDIVLAHLDKTRDDLERFNSDD